jgi:glycosyltransferase involved in cell wall biosynthesis
VPKHLCILASRLASPPPTGTSLRRTGRLDWRSNAVCDSLYIKQRESHRGSLTASYEAAALAVRESRSAIVEIGVSPLRLAVNVAIIHYWLVRLRGGEAVLKQLMSLYGQAQIYTNVYDPIGAGSLFSDGSQPMTTSVNRLPFASKLYPLYMPLMPAALERLDMSPYDLIISSEAGPSKWVIPNPLARHICYVHSPMRYLWDQRLLYRNRVPAIARPLFDSVTENLRYKDVGSAARVDDFVANSSFVAARIRSYYRREARVIHPPVEVADFGQPEAPEDYYLLAGQLVSYKATRVAVDACVRLGRRLIVVGDGPDGAYVRQFSNRGVESRGRVSRAELIDLMARCRALIFPGVEDFGMVPVEVMAAGRPVIAYGRGGILDSVADKITGVLYSGGDVDSLARAICDFESWEPDFDPQNAVQAASRFSPDEFRRKWRAEFPS